VAPRTQRALLGLSALGATLLDACIHPPPHVADPMPWGLHASRTFGDVRVHLVNTGWVRVKEAHRTLGGRESLRLPAILFDDRWTEFMPVWVAVIDHPEGVFLVDAGMSEDTLDPSHFNEDVGNSFVYSNLLDFRFDAADRIDRWLPRIGVDPARVRGVVVTHRHADHADALVALPERAEVFVGAPDWPGHQGALSWPLPRPPTLVPVGEPLEPTWPLTRDGRLSVVALPGHSPGHLGLLLRAEPAEDGRTGLEVLVGGDVAFSLQQIRDTTLAGIVESPSAARASLEALRTKLEGRRTLLLLTHDPSSAERLERGEPSSL
jgi:N-acyl homoserine lactone hydrolase